METYRARARARARPLRGLAREQVADFVSNLLAVIIALLASQTDNWAPELLGRTVAGRYRLESVLGTGGMGAVFTGIHLELRRTVAVKVLGPHLVYNAAEVERFRREARRAATIRHRGIVDVLDFDVDPEVGPFLVMEHLRGETLADYAKRVRALPVFDVRRIGSEILDSLGAVHANGIIHRDLKPANIFLEIEGNTSRARLLDFGVSLALHGESPLTKPGFALGTLRYMSPEQARGQALDHRTDIYAMGHILRYCLTGQKPFHGIQNANLVHAIMEGEGRPLRLTHPHLPPSLCSAIDTAISSDRERRFASAFQFKAALDAIPIPSRNQSPAIASSLDPTTTLGVTSSDVPTAGPVLSNPMRQHPPPAAPMITNRMDADRTVLDPRPAALAGTRIMIASVVILSLAAIATVAFLALPNDDPAPLSTPPPSPSEPISSEPVLPPPGATAHPPPPPTALRVDAAQFDLSPVTARYLVATVDVPVVQELDLAMPSPRDPRIELGRRALAESRLREARENFQAILDDPNAPEQLKALAHLGLGDADVLTLTLFHGHVDNATEWWNLYAIFADLAVSAGGHYSEGQHGSCYFTHDGILHDQSSVVMRRLLGDPTQSTDPILVANAEGANNPVRTAYNSAIYAYEMEASSVGNPQCVAQANRLLATVRARPM